MQCKRLIIATPVTAASIETASAMHESEYHNAILIKILEGIAELFSY